MEHLAWTGERLVTQADKLHGTIEHLHRYAVATGLCEKKIVLDIACGEGYGSNLLSKVAARVYGVDISEEAVAHATRKYKKENLSFIAGSADKIPLEQSSVDVVVSFETLEHHDRHQEMMDEVKRVLKPGGKLLLSSPEKTIYKDRDADNPYHIKEITFSELKALIKSNFKYSKFYEQRFVFGSLITAEANDVLRGFGFYDGNFDNVTSQLNEKEDKFYNRVFFNLVLASDEAIAEDFADASFFNGARVLASEIEIHQKTIAALKNSNSYKLGNFMLKPLALLKSVFGK
jgi:ubiquinone/menaquinone biosynthesis C-methylase UbiE